MDPVSLTELVEQHYALLYHFAYRLSGSGADAEDLVQQTFLAAHENLSQLRSVQSARGWLCTILRNLHRKKWRSEPPPMSSIDCLPAPVIEPKVVEVTSEELQKGLQELPDEYREILVLYYFGEYSYKQLSEELNIPLGTVMSRLARGKKHLRDRLFPNE